MISCLSEDSVIGLLAGMTLGAELAVVEQHLDACGQCRRLLSAFVSRRGAPARTRGIVSAFAAGEVLGGRYRIVGLLGTGGMGEVYEAMDTLLGETIALKGLVVGASLDARGEARLKAEAQLARRVTHRNVCRVFDVGFHRDRRPARERRHPAIPFLTMELLRGVTLRAHLQRQGRQGSGDTMLLLEQLAAGLDAAHDAGVVHADLKSENVMLVADGASTRAVITDFGLARRLDGASGDRRSVAGTAGYMAPEQVVGEAPGPAADIHALGIVLLELLTGELPLRPLSVATGSRNHDRALRLQPRVPAPLPARWRDVIVRCIDPAPSKRFQRAGDVLRAARQGE